MGVMRLLRRRLPRKVSGMVNGIGPKPVLNLFAPTVSIEKLGLPRGSSDPLISSLDGNYFRGKLEKHLNDVDHGVGYLSKDTGAAVLGLQSSASDQIGSLNFKALSQYSGYLTALTYDQRARFVTGVEQSTNLLSSIPTDAQAQKATQSILAHIS